MQYRTVAALGREPSQWVTDAGAFVSGVITGPTGLLAPVTSVIGAATGTQQLTHVGAALHGPQTAQSLQRLESGRGGLGAQLGAQFDEIPGWLAGDAQAGTTIWWIVGGLLVAATAGGIIYFTAPGR